MSKKTTTNHVKKVNLGDVFNIELAGNETTGYTWALAQMPPCVILLDTNYTVNPHSPGSVGAQGIKTLTFKAMAESTGENLKFCEIRPWMSTPIKEEEWKLVVDGKITYERYTDYFAIPNYKEPEYLVLTSTEQFEKNFHPAPIGKPQQWIEPEAFEDNLVVAGILPPKSVYTEETIEKVEVVNNALVVSYSTKETPITWVAKCCWLILVKKASYAKVKFIENGVEKATVPVK